MSKALITLILFFNSAFFSYGQDPVSKPIVKTIFAYGGEINPVFFKYIITLTGKEKPRICFIPTASADDNNYINFWFGMSANFQIEPDVMKVFQNTSPDQKTFEETLLQADAIIVGGGNTVNMMAIWKAQGIDTVLRKVYEKGIILAGGSAGSLCWFISGPTDSRPKNLTIVNGLGFIEASHCPHFSSEKDRKPFYEQSVLKKDMPAGYACDDLAGMLFKDGKFVKAVSLNKENNVYFVSAANGRIKEENLAVEIIK